MRIETGEQGTAIGAVDDLEGVPVEVEGVRAGVVVVDVHFHDGVVRDHVRVCGTAVDGRVHDHICGCGEGGEHGRYLLRDVGLAVEHGAGGAGAVLIDGDGQVDCVGGRGEERFGFERDKGCVVPGLEYEGWGRGEGKRRRVDKVASYLVVMVSKDLEVGEGDGRGDLQC